MSEKQRLYVLDTNVLVHDPNSLFVFEGARVGIPAIVLEEIDEFKSEPSARGRNTREVIRHLDMLRERGPLGKGVTLDNGSVLQVLFVPKDTDYSTPFALDVADNRILLIAYVYQRQGYDVRFVSKDLNARVKADALGLEAVDYKQQHVSKDSFYRGWTAVSVPAVQLQQQEPQALKDLLKGKEELLPNQYVLLESQHNPHNYRVWRYIGGKRFAPVEEPRLQWPLSARNPEQLMALNALLDDSIQLVTLFGPAGTGKTFLTLLAALHKVLVEDMYKKILISRPVVPLGKDIGYLPGTIEEKLHSWMLPIYDNIDLIIHEAASGEHLETIRDEQQNGKRRSRRRYQKKRSKGTLSMEELVRNEKISLEAITYMRGRSIPYQFILIDEVQNLNPHEVKTLVSRVGEGSKIVLAGDPYQIDSPYLDFSSNGLVVTSERFKGQQLFASVYLQTSERSELSQLANDLL